jgi:hypothetical protein
MLGVADESFTPPTGEAFGGYFAAPGTNGGAAVYGNASGSGGIAVAGAGYGAGVQGHSSQGNGVVGLFGSATVSTGTGFTNSGVYGATTGGNGFGDACGVTGFGQSSNSCGVQGIDGSPSGNQIGIFGSSTNGLAGKFAGNVDITGTLTLDGSACAAGCTSDERLKKNIAPLRNAMDTLLKLRGVSYEWRSPPKYEANRPGARVGFIAQDVEKVFPQWVGENQDGFKTLTISPPEFSSLVVESVRTLKAENDELRDRVKSLEAGRRPMTSGFGDGGVGLGLLGVAAAVAYLLGRRRVAA